MYALDSMMSTPNLKPKIDKIVMETLNPNHEFWRIQLSIIALLCKRILLNINCNNS